MPPSSLVEQTPGPYSLAVLLEELTIAREDVDRLRRAPIDQQRLQAAQQTLLRAMELYAAALTARGLPTPWKLRDEMRLQRGLGRQRDTRGGRR